MNIRKSHQIPDSSEVKYCILYFVLFCWFDLDCFHQVSLWFSFFRVCLFVSSIWIVVFIVLYVVV